MRTIAYLGGASDSGAAWAPHKHYNMTAATPQPASAQVIDGVNHLRQSGRILGERDWDIVRLLRDAERVVKVSPMKGWVAKACVLSLTGNAEKTDAAFHNARMLASSVPERVEVCANWIVASEMLGRFDVATSLLDEIMSPQSGPSSAVFRSAATTGHLGKAAQYVQFWQQQNQPMDQALADKAILAARVLEREGISDAEVTQQLEVATGVLVRRGLVSVPYMQGAMAGEVFRVMDVPGEFQGVVYALRVKVSPEEAMDLNIDFAVAKDEIGIAERAGLTVAFVAV